MRSRAWLAVLVLAAGCTSGVVKPVAPVRLVYAGAAGDVRGWKLEQVVRGEFAFNGMPQLLAITLRGTLTERIGEVTPEGWRKVVQSWAFDPLELNGLPMPLPGIPDRIESRVVRGPTGEMQALEQGADPAGDLLAWAARWIGGFFPLLADHAVLTGEPWSRTDTVPAAGGAEFRVETKGTLTGMDGGVAVLATEGEIALTRTPAGSGMDAFRLKYSGDARFDLVPGRVTASHQSGTLTFRGRAGKSPVNISAKFTSALTEAAPAPPPPAAAAPAPVSGTAFP